MCYSGTLISSFRKYLQKFIAIEVGSSSTLELVASFQFNWIRRHHKRPATAKPTWLNHFRTIIVHVFLYTRKWRGKSISSAHTLCESVTEGFYKEVLDSPLEAIVVRVSNVSSASWFIAHPGIHFCIYIRIHISSITLQGNECKWRIVVDIYKFHYSLSMEDPEMTNRNTYTHSRRRVDAITYLPPPMYYAESGFFVSSKGTL